jgi:hypothetical protein
MLLRCPCLVELSQCGTQSSPVPEVEVLAKLISSVCLLALAQFGLSGVLKMMSRDKAVLSK